MSLLDLLKIDATTIASNAAVSDDYGALSATNDSTILDMSVLNHSITVTSTTNQYAIHALLNPLDISITLNEQSTTGNEISSQTSA